MVVYRWDLPCRFSNFWLMVNIDICQAQKLQPPHLSFNISIVLQIDFNLPFSEVFLRIGSMITCSSRRECRLSDAIDVNLLGLVIYTRTNFSWLHRVGQKARVSSVFFDRNSRIPRSKLKIRRRHSYVASCTTIALIYSIANCRTSFRHLKRRYFGISLVTALVFSSFGRFFFEVKSMAVNHSLQITGSAPSYMCIPK